MTAERPPAPADTAAPRVTPVDEPRWAAVEAGETAAVTYCLRSAAATVTTEVRGAGGAVVRVLERATPRAATPCDPAQDIVRLAWDGRDADGALVPTGAYEVVHTAVGADRTTTLTQEVGVLRGQPLRLVEPAAGAVLRGPVAWRVEAALPEVAQVESATLSCAGRVVDQPADGGGSDRGAFEAARCPTGPVDLVAGATWTDPAGARHRTSAPAVPVVVAEPAAEPRQVTAADGTVRLLGQDVVVALRAEAPVGGGAGTWTCALTGSDGLAVSCDGAVQVSADGLELVGAWVRDGAREQVRLVLEPARLRDPARLTVFTPEVVEAAEFTAGGVTVTSA